MRTMEWIGLAGSVVTAICALIGTYFANKKQTALMAYRLEQLEEKVGKHNNLEGRIIALETHVKDLHP